jgi:hypothetical protein
VSMRLPRPPVLPTGSDHRSSCDDSAMHHKPVIGACDWLCALDMRLRNIIVFAGAGRALLPKGDCDATDQRIFIGRSCARDRRNGDACGGCAFQRGRGYVGACSDRKAPHSNTFHRTARTPRQLSPVSRVPRVRGWPRQRVWSDTWWIGICQSVVSRLRLRLRR